MPPYQLVRPSEALVKVRPESWHVQIPPLNLDYFYRVSEVYRLTCLPLALLSLSALLQAYCPALFPALLSAPLPAFIPALLLVPN